MERDNLGSALAKINNECNPAFSFGRRSNSFAKGMKGPGPLLTNAHSKGSTSPLNMAGRCEKCIYKNTPIAEFFEKGKENK